MYTVADINELLDKAVLERGADYVYAKDETMPLAESTRCLYVHSTGPGCIVGHVLSNCGVALSKLEEHESEGAFAVSNAVLEIEPQAQALLEQVQSRQDEGVPWGEAVEAARRAL